MRKIFLTLGVALLSLLFLGGGIFLYSSVKEYLHDKNADPPETADWLNRFSPDYREVKSYCLAHINCISDFKKFYPHSAVFISPRNGNPDKHSTTVCAQTLVDGRYYVQLAQEIRTNKAEKTAVPLGEPNLVVLEIASYSGNGGLTVYGPTQIYGADWAKLSSADGDLSSIISNLDKDHPLPKAEEYLKDLEDADKVDLSGDTH